MRKQGSAGHPELPCEELRAQEGSPERGSFPERGYAVDEPTNVEELQVVDMHEEDMDGLVVAANDSGDWAPPQVGPGHKGGPGGGPAADHAESCF